MKTHKAVLFLVFFYTQAFQPLAAETKISPANAVRLATEQLFEVAKKNEFLLVSNPEKFIIKSLYTL